MAARAGGAVTGWLLSGETGADDLSAGAARRLSDVADYREAVADVLAGLAGRRGDRLTSAEAERRLAARLSDPAFAMILSATPAGPEAAARRVLREIRTYRHCARSSAGNLTAMIRIALLAQIDVFWWGNLPAYQSDADVHDAADLLDLDGLRRDGMLAVPLPAAAHDAAGPGCPLSGTPGCAGPRLRRPRACGSPALGPS